MSLPDAPYESYEVDSSMCRIVAFEVIGTIEYQWDGAPERQDYGDVLVAYNDGTVWRYHGVLRSTFDAIRTADSVGRAINALLKQRGAKREVKG